MSTTIATRRAVHRSRRALLVVSLAAALVIGTGIAAASLTSSDGASGLRTRPAPAVATNVDAQAIWDQLSSLSANQRDDAVAGLAPEARAQLRDLALEIAVAAEHH